MFLMGIILGELEFALNCYKIWVILEATLYLGSAEK